MQARRQTSRSLRYSIPVFIVICLGSFSLVTFSSQGAATVALEIFAISAIGFSVIALFSYRSVIFWRAVDFPWILTSFAAIVVSLVNISANDEKQYVATAKNEISKAFSDLTYVTRNIITSDCETQRSAADVRPRSPEPYSGACDRMRHFLPQMIRASQNISDKINSDELKEWARNLTVSSDLQVSGAWKDQVAAAETLVRIIDRYTPRLQRIDSVPADAIENFILSTRLRLWYFVMAFFVGLRLSRTTAEVLQVQSSKPISDSRAGSAIRS